MRVFVEQRFGRHQKSRRAVAALRGAQIRERVLQGMQPAIRGEALDRRHSPSVAVRAQHEAGQHRLVVEQHRAGTALTELAAVLGAAQVQIFTQDLEQRLVRRERDFGWLAVDEQFD